MHEAMASVEFLRTERIISSCASATSGFRHGAATTGNPSMAKSTGVGTVRSWCQSLPQCPSERCGSQPLYDLVHAHVKSVSFRGVGQPVDHVEYHQDVRSWQLPRRLPAPDQLGV